MKATRVLELQHQQVTTLINQLLRRRVDRNRIVNELADAIAAHELIEEEILYPVARSVQSAVIDHSVEEHDVLAIEVQRLLATPRNAREFDVRLSVIRTMLQHHLNIEENAVFPTIDQILSPQQNELLGRRLEARFNQVLPAGSQQILAMRQTQIACPEPGAIEVPGQIISPQVRRRIQ